MLNNSIAWYGTPSFFHRLDNGYQHAFDFKVTFAGLAYAPLIVSVLWNEKKTLIPGTLDVSTVVTGSSLSVSKEGTGWAVLADVPSDDVWTSHQHTIIKFRKRFTLEVPLAPGMAVIPRIGELLKEVGATRTSRLQVEGYFDVITKFGHLENTVY